jgi:hypothetical protein
MRRANARVQESCRRHGKLFSLLGVDDGRVHSAGEQRCDLYACQGLGVFQRLDEADDRVLGGRVDWPSDYGGEAGDGSLGNVRK